MEIKITEDTVLKNSSAQASTLEDKDKFIVKKGTSYQISAFVELGGHIKFTLAKSTILGKNTWYVWAGHAEVASDGIKYNTSKVLAVKFFPQTDNKFQPERTCNSSTHAMLINFLKPECISTDDQYIELVRSIGDTTDHNVHTKLLADFGIVSYWSQKLDFNHINDQLDKNIPVPIGILHRGTLASPTGGHIILVIGKYEGGYIVHDPYGSVMDGYQTSVYKGQGASYSKSLLDARWLVHKANNGWGRIITSIDGKYIKD